MRWTALGLLMVVAGTAQAQFTLPMQTYNSQLQNMQPMYQMQAPFSIYSPRSYMAEMSSSAMSMDPTGGFTAESRGVPRVKIEDESERPAPTPTFSIQSGSFDGPITVTISDAAPGATIYYTLDGKAPQWDSPVYTGPLTISKSAHLVAIAIPAHKLRSAPATASYEVKQREIF